jgi:hypothetical protein
MQFSSLLQGENMMFSKKAKKQNEEVIEAFRSIYGSALIARILMGNGQWDCGLRLCEEIMEEIETILKPKVHGWLQSKEFKHISLLRKTPMPRDAKTLGGKKPDTNYASRNPVTEDMEK